MINGEELNAAETLDSLKKCMYTQPLLQADKSSSTVYHT